MYSYWIFSANNNIFGANELACNTLYFAINAVARSMLFLCQQKNSFYVSEDRNINNSLSRVVVWQYESGPDRNMKCLGKFVREVCVFGIGNLQNFLYAPHFFANKFYKDFQYFTLDCLEELHVNRTLHPSPIDTEYYLKHLPKKLEPIWY